METIENISLDLIDDPEIAMRSQIDDDKLVELASSIKQHGLIQPITLRKVGSRYEVVAGHRRFIASKIAQTVMIKAIVRDLDDEQTDGMRMHENLYREDVNPVDEARYIQIMVDKHKVSPEALAKMTGKSEQYLMARYELLEYPEYLLKAIESGHISLSAGHWLNKISDDIVKQEYVRFAVGGGITAKRAEAWFRSFEAGNLPREASSYVAPAVTPNLEPRIIKMKCVLCRNEDAIDNMSMYYAHPDCAKAVEHIGQ